MVFSGYLHSSSAYFVLPSNSLRLWLPVPRLLWSYLVQTSFILWLRTTLMGFGISFRTRLRMVPSLDLLGNCCCRKILRMIGSFPSLFRRSIRKLIACLPISGLLFLSVHLSTDDRQSYSPGVFLKLCIGFSRIRTVNWVPLSETIWLGTPYNLRMLSMYSCANLLRLYSVLTGINCATFVSRSTITLTLL